jgi:DUF4097 and DUF4098 domain-containing protein YvlB
MTDRSLRLSRTFVWMAAAALGLALTASLPALAQPSLTASGDGFTATTTRTFSVEPGGSFALRSRGGPVSVASWDRSEVEVTETVRLPNTDRDEAERYLRERPTSYETNNNTVSVEGPDDRGRVQRTYTIRLPRRFSADLETRGGPISVEALTGDVVVRTAGGSLRLADIDGTVDVRTSGGSIDAGPVTGPLTLRTAGGSIQVADAGASVEAETAGGSIRVDAASGRVRARTAGGNIRILDAGGSVDAETAGGNVVLNRIGGAVRARTAGGDIEGDDLRGPVEARTSAGDIELSGVRAGIDARASVGDIEVGLSPSDFDVDYASSLESSMGDIRLTIPADLPATIEARVERFYGRVDRDDIVSDFALRREAAGSGPLRASGTLNGGGPTIELRSKNGSIELREQ